MTANRSIKRVANFSKTRAATVINTFIHSRKLIQYASTYTAAYSNSKFLRFVFLTYLLATEMNIFKGEEVGCSEWRGNMKV